MKNFLNTYYRYYGVLNSISKRIPVSEVVVTFNWYDIYKTRKTGSGDINYEKACVLFNIAALLSQLGAQENLQSNDGIKNSCSWFRLAGGTFEMLKEMLEQHPEAAVSEDLSSDSLRLYINLMLAQVQELIYLRASQGEMKAGVVSKLAAQAADYYQFALELINTSSVKNLVNKKWKSYCEFKQNCLVAISHYQLGLQAKESQEYGNEVARYRVAYKYIDNCVKGKYTNQVTELKDWFQTLSDIIKQALSLSQRDNDTIYHEVVLPEHKLPPLGKKAMANLTRIPDENLFLTLDKDPFCQLIPWKIRESDSIYSERKSEILRSIIKEVEDINNEAKNLLNQMQLPGSIEAHETPQGIPVSLKKKNGSSNF